MGYNYRAVQGEASYDANIALGTRLADIMFDLGAGHDSQAPPAPSAEAWAAIPDHDDDENGYLEGLDRLTSPHGDGPPGIPLHKIDGSNDGWLVTEQEIRDALAVIDASPPPALEGRMAEFWTAWVEFMRAASTKGGFRTW
ncbi:hypothetical protein [Demequina gelatinilytica]|uniref:hypothetical protein n=1 Tax=Demequina gelatinilytica TaxID=1638980 RepID=UPI0007849A8D|nr:hypothetical protein [Demequina gelatinilytica]